MSTQPPYEIERAFIVITPPENYDTYPHQDIEQGYYTDAQSGIVIRLRRKGNRYYQTIKKGVGLVREEVEHELTADQFNTLWPQTEGWRLTKVRYEIPEGSHTIELDVYKGPFEPLITAEVEFDSVEASQSFSPLAWMDTEVTEDIRYTNAQLAKNGLPSLSTRRTFIKQSALGLAGSSILLSCSDQQQEATAPTPATMIPLYIGTYTNQNSQGIYRALFNEQTGELSDLNLATEASNPSFIAIHPQQTHVYAVHEVSDFDGMDSGAISAYAIESDGSLSLQSTQITRGGAPCYVSLDAHGRWALIANYGGGNITLLPIDANGQVQEASSFIQHEGSSVNSQRQEAPHAHCILLDPTGNFAYSADLGIDKVMIYKLDQDAGLLLPNDPPFASVTPGAGPRHFVFHPNGRHAFVINELDSTITAFGFDASTGALNPLSTASTLPPGYQESNSCADIHVHPNGRFVYGSNRGHDSIAILAFDDQTGNLSFLGTESTQGSTPRNFTLDPTGQFLLAANQRSGTIVSFKIDAGSGLLTPTGHTLEAPTPVCLKFA